MCGPKCCFFSIYMLYFRFLWQAHYVKISEKKKIISAYFCATQNCLLVTRMLHCEISLLQKALVVAEQQALHSRLSQTQEACDHLKEQLEALRRNSLSLQDSCTSLQTLNTQLQVTALCSFNFCKANRQIIKSLSRDVEKKIVHDRYNELLSDGCVCELLYMCGC